MKYPLICFFLVVLKLSSFGQKDSFYYDNIYPYHDGYSLVTLGGKFGIIDHNFEEIIPPILHSINNYDLSDYFFGGVLYGVINDSIVLFDTLGNRTKAYMRSEGYPPQFWNKSYNIDSLSVSGVEGGRGCYLPDGHIIIPHDYRYIYKGLNEHLIAFRIEEVFASDPSNLAWAYKDITLIYNRIGDTLYEHIGRILCWQDAELYFVEKLGDFSVTNYHLDTIRTETFKSVSITDSLCWVKTDSGWGLINKNFEYKIKPQFSYLHVNPYWTVVGNGQKFGFITRSGIQITEIEYDGDWTQYTGDDSIIVAYKNDHLVFLNLLGECIYNCDEPGEILKHYSNGNIMVQGSFENYSKTGTWFYYRNDPSNSVRRKIVYADSNIVYKELDTNGLVTDTWEEKRMLTK